MACPTQPMRGKRQSWGTTDSGGTQRCMSQPLRATTHANAHMPIVVPVWPAARPAIAGHRSLVVATWPATPAIEGNHSLRSQRRVHSQVPAPLKRKPIIDPLSVQPVDVTPMPPRQEVTQRVRWSSARNGAKHTGRCYGRYALHVRKGVPSLKPFLSGGVGGRAEVEPPAVPNPPIRLSPKFGIQRYAEHKFEIRLTSSPATPPAFLARLTACHTATTHCLCLCLCLCPFTSVHPFPKS